MGIVEADPTEVLQIALARAEQEIERLRRECNSLQSENDRLVEALKRIRQTTRSAWARRTADDALYPGIDPLPWRCKRSGPTPEGMTRMTSTRPCRECIKLRTHLSILTAAVTATIKEVDQLMRGRESYERGQRIAKLLNVLEIVNDRTRYFGMNVDWRTDRK